MGDLIIPDYHPSKTQRKERLWEHTCFEIFFAQKGMPNYWEFNLSPSGDWNTYSFSSYRQGMKQETYFDALPFKVEIRSDQKLKLDTVIDLKFVQDLSSIDIGLSAVLEHNNGTKSFWAVNHPGKVPDFHDREGWNHFDT